MGSGMFLPVQSAINTLDVKSKPVETSGTKARFNKYLTRELEDSSYKKNTLKYTENTKSNRNEVEATEKLELNPNEVESAENPESNLNKINAKVDNQDEKNIIDKQINTDGIQVDQKDQAEPVESIEQLEQAVLVLQSIIKELVNISKKNNAALGEGLGNTDVEDMSNLELKSKLNEISSLLSNLQVSKDENGNTKVEADSDITLDSMTKQSIQEILDEVTQQGLIKENFARILEKKDSLNKAQEKMLDFVNKISEENFSLQDLKQAVANVVKNEENPNNQVLGALSKEVKDILKNEIQNLAKDSSSENGQSENKQLLNKENKINEKLDLAELKQNHKFSLGIEETIKEAVNSNLTKPSAGVIELSSTSIKSTTSVDPKIFTSILDVKQVASDINVNFLKGNSEVNISMKPEYLGELNVKMTIKADQVTLIMKTDNAVAKQALESSINQLKEALGQHGIKIATYEISTGNEMNLNNQNFNSKFDESNRNNLKQNSFFDNQNKEFTEKEANQDNPNNFTWKKQNNLGVLDYFA